MFPKNLYKRLRTTWKNTTDTTWKGKLYSSSFKPNSISFCWNHELTTFFMRVKLTLMNPNTLQKFDFIRSDEGWNGEVLDLFNRWRDMTTPKCKWELPGRCEEFEFTLAALFIWGFPLSYKKTDGGVFYNLLKHFMERRLVWL